MYVLASPAAPGGGASTEHDLVSFLRIFTRRKGAMAVTFAAFFLLVVALTLLAPKTYTTQVQLIAGNPGNPTQTGGAAASNLPILNALILASGEQSAETYAALFQEVPVAQAVIQNLHLNVPPGALLEHVKVQPVTNTALLTLTVDWSNPQMSAAIANGFGNAIVDRQRELVASQAETALTFLSGQLPPAEDAMRAANDALARYEARHRIADINAQTQSLVTSIANLDTQIDQSKVDRRQAQAEMQSVQGQLAGTSATINGGTQVAANPVLAQLQQQFAQVNLQLATALQKFTSRHPVVIGLKQQRQQLQQEIAKQQPTVVAATTVVPNPVYQQLQQEAAQYASAQDAASARYKELEIQRKALDPKLKHLPLETARFADIARRAKSAQDVYAALLQKYNDATIAKTTALSDVTITQPATAQMAVKSPNVKRNLAIGAILGLLLAVAVAFILDMFDRSVRDEMHAEREIGVPMLSTIPLVKLRDGKPEESWVRNLTVESFLQLASSIKYAAASPVRTISVTSPMRGEGKSTVALNVALAMAEIDPRVLLVDATFKSAAGEAASDPGLAEVLLEKMRLRDAVQSTPYGTLDFLSSGSCAGNPMRLLQQQRFEIMLAEALETYTNVVVDSAAINGNVFSSAISRLVDGTVLVVSQGQSDVRLARKALRRLNQSGADNLLGFVLNRVIPRKDEYAPLYVDAVAGGASNGAGGSRTPEERVMISA